MQTWTCPESALYKIEAWGAQGGNKDSTRKGGYGGYTQGQKYITKGSTLYIVVGGQGSNSVATYSWPSGGYNGGGKGGAGAHHRGSRYASGAGGGGATHIATTNRGVLSNYQNCQGEILLVAGGGGGAPGWKNDGAGGGAGGGLTGGSTSNTNNSAAGGTQTSGYAFGKGADGNDALDGGDTWVDNLEGRGGGGGGWYGGQSGKSISKTKVNVGGGGGSGHIGSGLSNTSTQAGVRQGNGFARITAMHTHNSSGTEYSSTGDSTTHTKYTYCTDHGTDHSQNRNGTSESHVDSNNDGTCDKCGQVYRNRYYLDLNGILNGKTVYNITGYGTVDVYVEGRGTSQGVSDYCQYTAEGTVYSISPKANSGYTYLGVESGDISGTMPNAQMSVYLKFGSNYTINFDGNGADGGSTASEDRVYSDNAKELTANGFYRNKYVFSGWNTDADGTGTGYYDRQLVNDLTDAVNGTVTLYAQWDDAPGYHNGQAIVYTITYNLFPKNGSGVKITDPGNPTTYTIETPTFTLKNPSVTNYNFEGWYGSGTKGSKGVTIVQGSIGDLHFTADWLPTKDTNKSSGKDQNLPYVKTTDIIENNYKLAS